MKIGSKLISFLSAEWLLLNGHPNGGDVVIFRTLWVGTVLVILLATIQASPLNIELCEWGHKVWSNSILMLRGSQGPVIYGAVYAAFYARFTSQWTYMANLYNQIKQAEVSEANNLNTKALSQWKAGYIEDAYTTHMATKPTVAGVIQAWYAQPDVRDAFIQHSKDHTKIIYWLKKQRVLND
jgi:hypothetical protein